MVAMSIVSWCFVLALCVCADLVTSESGSNYSLCPTWFYFSNASQECKCGKEIDDKVTCNQHRMTAYIANGFCATLSDQDGLYYAGFCPFTHSENRSNRIFSEMPSDPEMLEDVMCLPYKRKGLLCGECINGHGPSVYSRDMKCTKCHTGFIVLYLLLELLPITIFFYLITFFNINITSGPLLGYILFCQAFVFSIQSNLDGYNYILSDASPTQRTLFQFSVAVSEIWTLQFLWSIIPSFCFSENWDEIDLQMLGLVKAVFPILLVIITYVIMQLHARHYRVLRVLWKPFGYILNKLHIVPGTSDVAFHTLAVFIFLSASAVAYNVYSVFDTVPVHRSIDGSIYKRVMLLDNQHTFGTYAFIAILAFFLLVFTPSLLLCVYPTRLYKNLKTCLGTRKQTAIATFAGSLNKCFKDGSNETWDMRSTAGLVLLTSSLIRPLGELAVHETLGSQFVMGAGFIFLSFIISYVRPCKLTAANFSLSYHSTLLGIFSIAAGLWRHDDNTGTDSLELTFIAPPVISHILVFLWALYVVTQHVARAFGYNFELKKLLKAAVNNIKRPFQRRRHGYEELIEAS